MVLLLYDNLGHIWRQFDKQIFSIFFNIKKSITDHTLFILYTVKKGSSYFAYRKIMKNRIYSLFILFFQIILKQFILLFKIVLGKTASLARNWINSFPQNKSDGRCLFFCLYRSVKCRDSGKSNTLCCFICSAVEIYHQLLQHRVIYNVL